MATLNIIRYPNPILKKKSKAIKKIEGLSGKKLSFELSDQNRIGDHKCYISDLSKIKEDYPEWKLSWSLDKILEDMVGFERRNQQIMKK